jgi:transposase
MNRLPKAVYTKEFRDQAVKMVLTDGLSASEAARRLSISMKTLANWLRLARSGKLAQVGQNQAPLTEMEMELSRMKRELAEVRMERDLLKKFAAYFAKESR